MGEGGRDEEVASSKKNLINLNERVAAIETDESETLGHTVRMNKQEANLAARPEALTSYNCLDFSFFVSSTAFEVVGKLSKYP